MNPTPEQYAQMLARHPQRNVKEAVEASRMPQERSVASPGIKVSPRSTGSVLGQKHHENPPNRQLQDPKPEHHQAPALGKAVPGEAEGVGRPVVRFTGFRVRLLDDDNFAGSVKDLLDGLRHALLIPDDAKGQIILQTEQEKVAHKREERTEIIIEYP